MRTEVFMFFLSIKKYIGTQSEVCRQLKIFYPPPPRWTRCCSYSVWLCGLYYRALHVLKFSCALCPRVSSFLLAL